MPETENKKKVNCLDLQNKIVECLKDNCSSRDDECSAMLKIFRKDCKQFPSNDHIPKHPKFTKGCK